MISVRITSIWLVKAAFLSTIFASKQPRLPIIRNEIRSLDVICDADTFNATLTLERPFKGMLSAKEFSQECNTFGTMSNSVTISLPTYGCGLRLSTKNVKNGEIFMQYSVTLAIQQDRHLRQIADQEIHVTCQINAEEFAFRSKSMVNEVENNSNENNLRSARMRQDGTWNVQMDKNKYHVNNRLQESIKSSKVWMEIVPDDDENNGAIQDKLQVGEPAKLIVKSTLPVGIGWKVVDCTAHDGLGDSSQKLLDERGCPVDEQLMPKPTYGPVRNAALTRYQEASATFPAFKFPDRDRLHLTCMMLICRGSCIQPSCNKTTTNDRFGKQIIEEKDDVLDQIKIFNSVEVLAPTVNEYYRTREYEESRDSSFTFKGIPGDETLCISYNKIAVTFCVLGMMFLIAALAAICGFLKARRSGHALSVYTRSIFSSSSATGSSQYGSKLLQDHSTFGFSSTGGLQYGRIL